MPYDRRQSKYFAEWGSDFAFAGWGNEVQPNVMGGKTFGEWGSDFAFAGWGNQVTPNIMGGRVFGIHGGSFSAFAKATADRSGFGRYGAPMYDPNGNYIGDDGSDASVAADPTLTDITSSSGYDTTDIPPVVPSSVVQVANNPSAKVVTLPTGRQIPLSDITIDTAHQTFYYGSLDVTQYMSELQKEAFSDYNVYAANVQAYNQHAIAQGKTPIQEGSTSTAAIFGSQLYNAPLQAPIEAASNVVSNTVTSALTGANKVGSNALKSSFSNPIGLIILAGLGYFAFSQAKKRGKIL